jgi:hypothetical protein
VKSALVMSIQVMEHESEYREGGMSDKSTRERGEVDSVGQQDTESRWMQCATGDGEHTSKHSSAEV